VTFTATVSSSSGTPAGKVTFKNGSAVLGTVTLASGVATFTTATLGVGTKFITAVYDGNAKYIESTSSVLSQVVNKATSTVALLSSLNPSTFGQSVTFTATVAPQFGGTPAGKITFKNGTATLGTVTLAGGVATFATTSLSVGTKSITAVYNGSASFSSSTSAILSQVVTKATSAVTLTSSQNPSTFGQSVTFTATVAAEFSGTPAGKVTFKDGSTTLGIVALASGVATFTTPSVTSGTHTIKALYGGGADFSANSATLTQTVN
jgi:Bacterial Ig-like domain (group 3)